VAFLRDDEAWVMTSNGLNPARLMRHGTLRGQHLYWLPGNPERLYWHNPVAGADLTINLDDLKLSDENHQSPFTAANADRFLHPSLRKAGWFMRWSSEPSWEFPPIEGAWNGTPVVSRYIGLPRSIMFFHLQSQTWQLLDVPGEEIIQYAELNPDGDRLLVLTSGQELTPGTLAVYAVESGPRSDWTIPVVMDKSWEPAKPAVLYDIFSGKTNPLNGKIVGATDRESFPKAQGYVVPDGRGKTFFHVRSLLATGKSRPSVEALRPGDAVVVASSRTFAGSVERLEGVPFRTSLTSVKIEDSELLGSWAFCYAGKPMGTGIVRPGILPRHDGRPAFRGLVAVMSLVSSGTSKDVEETAEVYNNGSYVTFRSVSVRSLVNRPFSWWLDTFAGTPTQDKTGLRGVGTDAAAKSALWTAQKVQQ